MPTSSGTSRTQDGIAEPIAGREREARAGEPRVVAGEQSPHDLPGLAHRGERRRDVDAERLEPRARDETEEGTTARRAVERRDLAGELDRVHA